MKYSKQSYPNLLLDRNRERQVVFYGRVSTEHDRDAGVPRFVQIPRGACRLLPLPQDDSQTMQESGVIREARADIARTQRLYFQNTAKASGRRQID